MAEHFVELGTFDPTTRTVKNVRLIKQSDFQVCPHAILAADHYRADGTCRCNDRAHTEMKGWGYKWRHGQWR